MGFHINPEMIRTNYTDELAAFVFHLRYEDIPAEVLEQAKTLIMSTVGAAVAAKGTSVAKQAVALGKLCSGYDACGASLWLEGGELALPGAVLTNTVLADALDWEPYALTGRPLAGIVPTAMACAQTRHCSGKELITAVVAAYEVYQRVAYAVKPPDNWPITKGWGDTSWQVFGTLIAAAKLLGLSRDQISQAIGFGVTSCPIPAQLSAVTFSDAYHFEYGFRSMQGVMCALNAQSGVDNYMDAFDDPWAFQNHMCVSPSPDWYTKGLGRRWLVMDAAIKRYPADERLQAPLELLARMVSMHKLTVADIDEIHVNYTSSPEAEKTFEACNDIARARRSTPFMLAVLLNIPQAAGSWTADDLLKNVSVLQTAAKIFSGLDDELSVSEHLIEARRGLHPEIWMEIRTPDGRILRDCLSVPGGHPMNALAPEWTESLLRTKIGLAFGKKETEEILHTFKQMECCEDVAQLCRLLY